MKSELLRRVKSERHIVYTVKRRRANWICHMLRRKCLLKHVIEVKMEGRRKVTGRQGEGREQLLDGLK